MAALASPIDLSKGTVTWFDVGRGFGFITPEDGGENLFVHQSSIKAVGYRSLTVGEAVEFFVSVGDDGRRRAVSVTGPGGALIEGRRYFGGACYRCGEIGHMAMHCKSNVAGNSRLGPCYKCEVMGHLARDCPATLIEPSSPKSNVLKPSKLGSINPFSRKEEIRNLSDRLSENVDSEEEEEEDDDEINHDDSEYPRGVEQRNWADLPRDVVLVIFNKITAVDIIRSAQFVCRSWKQLSQEPELWRHIIVKMPNDFMDMSALESLAMLAVDRSEGCVEEFHLESFASKNDELIYHMSDRATKLRRLRLISIYYLSEKALAHAIRKFPLLEELEISHCCFSSDLVELVGIACPRLNSLRLNARLRKYYPYDYDSDSDRNSDAEAFSIAKHMQQLQCLQLVGNHLTNIGLLAILDNCPNLQCLDIRACFNVDFDENMRKKCAKMKELRLPRDSAAGFDLSLFTVDLPLDNYSDSDYEFGYFDQDGFSDMSFDDFLGI